MNDDVKSEPRYCSSIPEIVDKISDYCKKNNYSKILEIGPGYTSFPLSTHFVDYIDRRPHTVIVDVSKESLPFKDKEFDFVYCRHVIEDMYNPFLLLNEINRVSNAGYFETPSPLIEMSRYIDDGHPQYRGYIHHRYIVYVDDTNNLTLISKYPFVEYFDFSIDDSKNRNYIDDKYLWNTYYLWEKEIKYKYLQLDIDYNIRTDYADLVIKAINDGIK